MAVASWLLAQLAGCVLVGLSLSRGVGRQHTEGPIKASPPGWRRPYVFPLKQSRASFSPSRDPAHGGGRLGFLSVAGVDWVYALEPDEHPHCESTCDTIQPAPNMHRRTGCRYRTKKKKGTSPTSKENWN